MNSPGIHPIRSETEAQVYKSPMCGSHPQKKNDAKDCLGTFQTIIAYSYTLSSCGGLGNWGIS